jgi:hypothetical protein
MPNPHLPSLHTVDMTMDSVATSAQDGEQINEWNDDQIDSMIITPALIAAPGLLQERCTCEN